MDIDVEFLQEVERVAASLETLDYYQVLCVEADADPQTIRAAYHRLARRYHPDRYHHLDLPRVTEDLTRIAKRVAEAYVILRDDAKRRHYTEAIHGPERADKLRYSEEDEQRLKKARETGSAETPQGKQLFAAARSARSEGKLDQAVKNLKMAIMYEPENETLKQLLEEWGGASKPPEPA